MDIFVNVIGQKLKIQSNEKKIISGAHNFVKLIFMVGTDWDSMNIHAYFVQGAETYDIVLNENNECYVPSGLTEGKCSMMLYGVGVGGIVIATTEETEFLIKAPIYSPSGDEEGDEGYDDDYVATIAEVRAYLGIT